MIRKFKFIQGTYYHICNRSNDESPIFLEDRDYVRFLFFILYYQAPLLFYNLGRQVSYFEKYAKFNVSEITTAQTITQRKAELSAFAIMPNHFHLLVQEKSLSKDGISKYLQRIQTGYAKYFNAKYKKRGHLFQGAFRAIPVQSDEQLLYLSAYIHRNPRDLKEWKNRKHTYTWSSYQDCIQENRWGQLLNPRIFLGQFSNQKSYERFVETSTAKLQMGESPIAELLLE
ncbi:transposase [Patescibacteria group bacterium]|nr:transposase [Patescibacteria group bacterium]